MSRWLVGSSSKQQIGVGDQRRAERDPALLAAGQAADHRFQPDVAQAQPGQHAADRAVRRPGVLGVTEGVQDRLAGR